MHARSLIASAFLLLSLVPGAPARADKQEISIVGQYGISYLPLMVMEYRKTVEQQARAAGLGEIKVTWDANAGPSGTIDALLTGARDIIGGGLPSLVTLWARTKGTAGEVRSIGAIQQLPLYLMARDPKVKTIRDFTETDRIALPSVKISAQAIALQAAAAKEWGMANYERLDPLTVSMGHPDATIAMLNPKGEITAHFAVAPFNYEEMAANPAIHLVLSTYDVFGRHNGGVLMARAAFVQENPRLYAAFCAAQEETNRFITEHPRDAAAIYLEMSRNRRQTVDDLARMISDPDVSYTTVPMGVMTHARFMRDTGRVKEIPASWQEYFFPNVHAMPGS